MVQSILSTLFCHFNNFFAITLTVYLKYWEISEFWVYEEIINF